MTTRDTTARDTALFWIGVALMIAAAVLRLSNAARS